MLITASELKANMGHYLDTASHEDVLVMRKGRVVAKLSNPASDKTALLDSLVGIAARTDLTAQEARAERLAHA